MLLNSRYVQVHFERKIFENEFEVNHTKNIEHEQKMFNSILSWEAGKIMKLTGKFCAAPSPDSIYRLENKKHLSKVWHKNI